VNGASCAKEKLQFLVELVHILDSNSLLFMLAGDFNIIRRASDRNKKM
jgi:exonuclease III